jgi:hypothetical protein
MDADVAPRKPLKPNARLRYYRRMRHWTQADLADQLYKLCTRKERGRGIINANMLEGKRATKRCSRSSLPN